jgi:hypothetical protein
LGKFARRRKLFSEYVLLFSFITFSSTILLLLPHYKDPCPLDAFIGWGGIPSPTRVVDGWGVTLSNSEFYFLCTTILNQNEIQNQNLTTQKHIIEKYENTINMQVDEMSIMSLLTKWLKGKISQ